MDASQFAMWLQGFAELNSAPPTPEQWESIREHLQLVFSKVTPEVKKAGQIDVTGNEDLQRRIKEARESHWHEPIRQPYQPYFLRSGDFPPGTIIC